MEVSQFPLKVLAFGEREEGRREWGAGRAHVRFHFSSLFLPYTQHSATPTSSSLVTASRRLTHQSSQLGHDGQAHCKQCPQFVQPAPVPHMVQTKAPHAHARPFPNAQSPHNISVQTSQTSRRGSHAPHITVSHPSQ